MSNTLLSIKQGTIGYPGKLVLENFDLQICKGEHWAITGQSASGKTTLLSAIAGNLQLKGGQIIRHFTNADDHNLGFHPMVAFVASKHHFSNLSNTSDFYYQQRYNSSDSEDCLTVSAYLQAINLQVTSLNYWDINRTIRLLKLTQLADKQLIKLSNGETKRLMIAAALLKNPVLLLLDNPLAGLDAQTRDEFDDIIKQISISGITVIIATSPHEIPKSITHIAILHHGNLSSVNKASFNANAVFKNQDKYDFDLNGLLHRYPAPAYQDIVKMHNVNIRYGNKAILNNIQWQIKQGQRWALLGPNGAGKSTLLSLINGDNPQAYANDIVLFDKKRGSGETIWDIKAKTGFISPELYQYFPADNSCLQTIESGYYDTMGLFRPSDKDKTDRAMQWMRVLGIDQYARHLLKNIPASAQRLCLLARAMIKCPTLLILDEPCQGMDNHQVTHFKALVDAICRETNITLVYVTHYTEHIPDSVKQILKLDKGCVVDNVIDLT